MFGTLRIDRLVARGFIFVVFAWLSVFASTHPAAKAEDGKSSENSASMAEFVRDDPSCIDFTDGCSVCTVAEGNIVCSAPRIQCQVKALTCTRR